MPSNRPTPTKLRLLKGDTGNKKKKKAPEPEYSKVSVAPPDALCEIGAAEWIRVVDEMKSNGVLTKADEQILFAYCDECATAERAVRELKGKPLIMKSPRGYPIQNPYLNIKRKSFLIMKTLAVELGLTPAARTKVSAVPVKAEDPYTKLKEDRAARLATVQANLKAGKAPSQMRRRRPKTKPKATKKPKKKK